MGLVGDRLENVKVALARLNGLFKSPEEMLMQLMATDYPEGIINPDIQRDLENTVFKAKMPKLVSLGLAREFVTNHFDESVKDYNTLLSLFPRNDFIYYFYNLLDNPWIKKAMGLILPEIPTNFKIRVRLDLFDEHLQTNDKFSGRPWRLLRPSFFEQRFRYEDLFDGQSFGKRVPDRFGIRVMSKRLFDLPTLVKNRHSMDLRLRQHLRRVILHVHGGGFIAMSSATHQSYLRNFVRDNDAVLFSIDYPLAPTKRFKSIFESVVTSLLLIKVDSPGAHGTGAGHSRMEIRGHRRLRRRQPDHWTDFLGHHQRSPATRGRHSELPR